MEYRVRHWTNFRPSSPALARRPRLEDLDEVVNIKIGPESGSAVDAVLTGDAGIRDGADLLGVKDDDFARMAETFGFSPEFLRAPLLDEQD